MVNSAGMLLLLLPSDMGGWWMVDDGLRRGSGLRL
jgi:hypothetical protein